MSNENPHPQTPPSVDGDAGLNPTATPDATTHVHPPPHTTGSASGSLHRWAQPRRDARLRAVWPVPLRAASRASRSRRRPVGSTMAHRWEFPDGARARGHGARGAPPRGRGAPPRARDLRPDSVSDLHSSCPSLPVASGVAVGSAAGAAASGGARPWRVARGCLRASLTSRLASLALASRLSGLRIRARSAVRVLRRGRGAWVERVEQLGGQRAGRGSGRSGQRARSPARPLAQLRQPAHCTAQGTDPRSTAR